MKVDQTTFFYQPVRGAQNINSSNSEPGYLAIALACVLTLAACAGPPTGKAVPIVWGPSGAIQSCTPPPSGLVSWWGGDGTGEDLTGGNGGYLQPLLPAGPTGPSFDNPMPFVPGVVGTGAFAFPGNSYHVRVRGSNNLRVPGKYDLGFSVEGWVRLAPRSPDDTTQQHLLGKHLSENGHWTSFTVAVDGDERLSFSVQNRDSGQHQIWRTADSESPLEAGRWYHFGIVWRSPPFSGVAVGEEGSIVVDGVKLSVEHEESAGYGTGFIVGASDDPLVLGLVPGSGNPARATQAADFMGYLDEISIYSRPLATYEVGNIYQAGRAGKCRPSTWMIDLREGRASRSQAVAIDDQGRVAGRGTRESGVSHAFIWQNGSLNWMPMPAGATAIDEVIDIRDGVVVGTARHDSDTGGQSRGFVWRAGIAPIILGGIDEAITSGSMSIPRSMNEAYVVVGEGAHSTGADTGTIEYHAFVWRPDSSPAMVDLGTLGGPNANSSALGINADGVVVGRATSSGGYPVAVRWIGGTIEILQRSAGGTLLPGSSVATAINDAGAVTGIWKPEDEDGPCKAFVWTESGGMVAKGSIGKYLGNCAGMPIAIGDDGTVLGKYQSSASALEPYRFQASSPAGDESDWRNLGSLSAGCGGTRDAAPSAVNLSGHVVGVSRGLYDHRSGFIWHEETGMVDLRGFYGRQRSHCDMLANPITTASMPRDVNNQGLVVGTARSHQWGTDDRAFLAGLGAMPLWWTSSAPLRVRFHVGTIPVTVTLPNVLESGSIAVWPVEAPLAGLADINVKNAFQFAVDNAAVFTGQGSVCVGVYELAENVYVDTYRLYRRAPETGEWDDVTGAATIGPDARVSICGATEPRGVFTLVLAPG